MVGTFKCNCFSGYRSVAPTQPYGRACFGKLMIPEHFNPPPSPKPLTEIPVRLQFQRRLFTDCCQDIDECEQPSLNQCFDKCYRGIESHPKNYTCSCRPGRYLVAPYACCKTQYSH